MSCHRYTFQYSSLRNVEFSYITKMSSCKKKNVFKHFFSPPYKMGMCFHGYFSWIKSWMSGTCVTTEWPYILTGILNPGKVSRNPALNLECHTGGLLVAGPSSVWDNSLGTMMFYQYKMISPQRQFHSFEPQDNNHTLNGMCSQQVRQFQKES